MLTWCLVTPWTYRKVAVIMLRWCQEDGTHGNCYFCCWHSSWPAPSPSRVTLLPPNHTTFSDLWYFPNLFQNGPNRTNHKKKVEKQNLTFAHCQVYLVYPSSRFPLCPVLPLSTLPPERPSTLTCSSSPLVWTGDCSQDARLQENETGMLFWLRPLRAGLLLHAR